MKRFLSLLLSPAFLAPLWAHSQAVFVRNGVKYYAEPPFAYDHLKVTGTPAALTDVANKAYVDSIILAPATTTNTGTNCSLSQDGVAACRVQNYVYSTPTGPGANGVQDMDNGHITVFGPGTNKGNSGGWSVGHLFNYIAYASRRGIFGQGYITINKRSVGDASLGYDYLNCDGGIAAQSDEGCSGLSQIISEPNGYFHGTVATGGTGAINPSLTFTSGSNWTSDGSFLLNISRNTVAGIITGTSTPIAAAHDPTGYSFVNALPVSVSGGLPLTTSWCTTLTTDGTPVIPDPAVPATSSASRTVACTVQPVNGVYVPMTPTAVAAVAGMWYPEQAPITAVGTMDPTTHVQSVTLSVRNPNLSAAIFEGGMVGQYCNFDSDFAVTGMRQSYYAYGSLNGSDLLYGYNLVGNTSNNTLPVRNGSIAAPGGANAGIHCYPGAEIVANRSTAYDPTLEPNRVSWTAGDLVENPHYPAHGGKGLATLYQQNTPCDPSFTCDVLHLEYGGKGWTQGAHAILSENDNPENYYTAGGGPWKAPTWATIQGPHGTIIDISSGPQASLKGTGALISVHALAGGATPSLTPFALFALPNTNVYYDPSNGHISTSYMDISYLTTFTAAAGDASHTVPNTQFVHDAIASAVTGYTGTKVVGTCTLVITNGLITSVTGC